MTTCVEPLPEFTGRLLQLERAGRQLLLTQQDAVDVDVRRGGGEQGAGKPHRGVAEEVGVEAEIPRHADAAEEGAAAQEAGADEGIADDPAPQAVALVQGQVGVAADELALGGTRDAAGEQVAGEADAGFAKGVETLEVRPVEGVIQKGAGVLTVDDIRWTIVAQIEHRRRQQAGRGREAQRQRRFIQLIGDGGGQRFKGDIGFVSKNLTLASQSLQASLLQIRDPRQHIPVAEHHEDLTLVDEIDGEPEDGALGRSRHAADGRQGQETP